MKKLAMFVAAIAAAPVLFAASVFADSPGSLATGPDLYQVKNVTKSSSYSSSVTATCDETVKFSLKLANSEYGQLDNVTVKAGLSGNVSASGTNAADKTVSVSGDVSVNITKGNLVYIPGSTVNLDVNGNVIKSLPDGITTSGVNKGRLKGSTREFVQFQAKVDCPSKPEVKKITVCELDTKKIVTINENDFDSKKYSKNLADCAETPAPGEITVCELDTKKIVTIAEDKYDSSKYSKDLSDCAETPEVVTELPKTGAGDVMLAGVGLSALVAGAAYALQRRNILG